MIHINIFTPRGGGTCQVPPPPWIRQIKRFKKIKTQFIKKIFLGIYLIIIFFYFFLYYFFLKSNIKKTIIYII
jgi:hypothetical protein